MLSKKLKLEKFYIWGIKTLIFAIPILPLYVSTSMMFPFITGKNFAFRILVEIAAVLWLGLTVLSKEYRLRNSIMLLAVLAFTFIVGLADILGVNPYNSLWSSYERMDGYLTILHLCLYFMIIKSVFITRKDWMIFLNIFVIVGALVSSVALYQQFEEAEVFRVSSTIGSPAFLASYLLLVVFIGLILIFNTKKLLLRYIYLLPVVLNSIAIYLTATRGVILSMVIGIMLFSLIYIFVKQDTPKKRLFKKVALLVFVGAIILSVAFWTFRDTDLIQQNRVFSRFTTMFSDPSVTFRLIIWEMAWEGIKESPVLGWGQENFMIVYTKYFKPELYGIDIWADRAHNIVLDWLINAGFSGLFFYLSIFGAVFYSLWSALQSKLISKAETITITIALIVYFFQNLFVFDTISTYIIFFALLAYVDSFKNRAEGIEDYRVENFSASAASGDRGEKIKPTCSTSLRPVGRAVTATLLVLVVFSFTAYFIHYKPIRESQMLHRIVDSSSDYTSYSTYLDDFKRALAYQTFGDTDVRAQMAVVSKEILRSKRFTDESALKFIQATSTEMEKQVAANPNNIEYLSLLVNLFNDIAKYEPSFIEKAEIYIKECLRLSPDYQWVYFALANNFLIKKDYDNVFLSVKRAVALDPGKDEPQFKLALVAILTSHESTANKALEKVKEIRSAKDKNVATGKKPVFSVKELLSLVDTSAGAENFKLSLRFYKKIIAVLPEEAQYHLEIAKVYLRLGDKANAIREAKKAAEIDPSNYFRAVEDFINSIDEPR